MSGHPDKFTSTQHKEVTPAVDPSKVALSPGFSVCVLGASRGIGASIAHAYAQAGASTIILAARNADALETVATKCGEIQSKAIIHCVTCDIASDGSVAALARRLRDIGLRLDVIVVNSGFAGPVITKVTDGDPADWKKCLEVNTLGTYHAAHHLLPILLECEGAKSFLVVSTAAVALTEGIIANPQYTISKLAQLRLVEMIAKQYASQGLLIVGIHPGAVPTEMSMGAPEEFKPCKKLGFPENILLAHLLLDLTDSVDLCGAYCVWLTKDVNATSWLSGRFISAIWDVEQLVEKKSEILEKDLLKFALRLS